MKLFRSEEMQLMQVCNLSPMPMYVSGSFHTATEGHYTLDHLEYFERLEPDDCDADAADDAC